MSRESEKATISSAYLEQARGEKRLKVFLNNRVVKVEMGAKGVISSVVAFDTLTGRMKRYRAKVFIDTTGDGWIGYYAGVPYRFGREGQDEFGEAEAPERPDRTTMSGVVITDRTWCFSYQDAGRAVKYETPPWAPGWKLRPARAVPTTSVAEGLESLVRLFFAWD